MRCQQIDTVSKAGYQIATSTDHDETATQPFTSGTQLAQITWSHSLTWQFSCHFRAVPSFEKNVFEREYIQVQKSNYLSLCYLATFKLWLTNVNRRINGASDMASEIHTSRQEANWSQSNPHMFTTHQQTYGGFLTWGYLQSIHFYRIFH